MRSTVFEQSNPFGNGHVVDGGVGRCRRRGVLARIDKIVVTPSLGCLLIEYFENWMRPNLAAPVFTVSEIALHAVHDSVPVTALGRRNVLADRVRTIEEIVQQPKSRQTAFGHAGIVDAGIKQVSRTQFAQFSEAALVRNSSGYAIVSKSFVAYQFIGSI